MLCDADWTALGAVQAWKRIRKAALRVVQVCEFIVGRASLVVVSQCGGELPGARIAVMAFAAIAETDADNADCLATQAREGMSGLICRHLGT